MRNRFLPALMGGVALLGYGQAAMAAEPRFNMTRGVTPVAHEVYDLHMLILWICVAIGLAVYAVMLYSIFNHRKSKGAVAAQFHEHPTLEVVWTVIPAVVLVLMAIPATQAMIKLYDTSDPDMTVKVTGYQWKWHYDYLDEGISFFSNLKTPPEQIDGSAAKDENYLRDVDNPVVLPIKTKIRFVITANDVLHAWWVPDFGWKQDAIPGFINENWAYIEEPGTYRGQCAELCGRNHGFMPIVVQAVPEDEYRQWVARQKLAMAEAASASDKAYSTEELMAAGEKVYQTTCVACHQANGQGVPGAFPALAGGAIATGPVAGHLNIVVNGKAGTAMQAFGAQLNDLDIAAVITYERNAFGNDSGDVVQPADVKAAR
ncbi:MAG: cytochrome c oxidase subunit II [Gammaproteobacteria bacterium]|nr:cytochrome c oxidase subunit II [Gammaproteobacteria bacterium]